MRRPRPGAGKKPANSEKLLRDKLERLQLDPNQFIDLMRVDPRTLPSNERRELMKLADLAREAAKPSRQGE